MSDQRRYWDADVFLGWFNEEDDRVEECRGILRRAENGTLTIVTSAITLTEVIFLRNDSEIRLTRESERKIRQFFENEYIEMWNADRKVCENARNLVWKYKVRPKDCIHAATAVIACVDTLDTYDGGLHQMDGDLETKDGSNLSIGVPNLAGYTKDIEFPGDSYSGKKVDIGKE